MPKRFSRGWLITLLVACIYARPAEKEKTEDGSYDFEDFSPEKFVGNIDEASVELPELKEISSTTAKNNYIDLPKILEPDAEMLPAHYTGVKPPGVDHMEIKFLDSSSQGTNLKNNLLDGIGSNGYRTAGGSSAASVKSSSGGGKSEEGGEKRVSFDKSTKSEKLKENHAGGYEEAAGKKKSKDETEKHVRGHKDEAAGERSESFEVEGHRQKGHNAAGYHNVYHKDEFKKDADFYDKDQEGGRYHKHGRYKEKHVATEGEFHKGGSHNSGFVEADAGKKGNFEKGRANEEASGHAAKTGYNGFFNKFDEFANKAGGASAAQSFSKIGEIAPKAL